MTDGSADSQNADEEQRKENSRKFLEYLSKTFAAAEDFWS